MSQVKPVPSGCAATSHLVCIGAAEAIEFYEKAFSKVELARTPKPSFHVDLIRKRIGNQQAMKLCALSY